jgi:hypothetical protein
MKIYFLLILTAITLSFSTAYFALNLEKTNFATVKEIDEISKIQQDFRKLTPSLVVINLSSMYPSRDYFQLIHPISIYSKNNLVAQDTYLSKDCSRVTERMSRLAFDKNEIWEDFRCKRISKLPPNFFEASPLIHDSGISYAYLAFLSGREPFINSEWIKGNINLFHVSELKSLPLTSLEGNFKILSRLNKKDYEEIVSGKKDIIGSEYYLVKYDEDQDIEYHVFAKAQFENFLKDRSFFVRPYQVGISCFYQKENLCFEKDSRNILQFFRQSSILIFLSSMMVLFFISIILFQKIKLQKHEEERKKHALRVLTHELRTPITNLLLLVESINKQSDIIPANILDDFLKIEGEVYRLKRLAEKSTSYLQTHEGKSLIALVNNEVPEIFNLLFEMTDDFRGKGVEFIRPVEDQAFFIDSYWLNICLKNLIENALVHGEGPVVVKADIEKDILRIFVTDSGKCPYESLDEMLKSDRAGKNSTGLGLGLSIVSKIISEMKGKIVFSKDPTTFTLYVRNNK